jgi:hypothetical protein
MTSCEAAVRQEVGAGGRSAAACPRCLGPLLQKVSSRFRFCPAAISIASMFYRLSVLSRNLLISCHSLASANMGSTPIPCACLKPSGRARFNGRRVSSLGILPQSYG